MECCLSETLYSIACIVCGDCVTRNSVASIALLLVFIISLFTAGNTSTIAERGAVEAAYPSVYVESQYTPHEPISINHDQDFADQGWPGNGSECNPYLIHGFSIAYDGPCISISHTSAHFKISDCFFTYENDRHEGRGVSLGWADNGIIENCRFVDLWSGLWLTGSNNSIIAFNEIGGANYTNVYLAQSYHCRIYNNSIGAAGFHGVQAIETPDLLLANNSFCGESYGVDVQHSVDCRVMNNEFEIVGLRITGTDRDHFLSNTFENNTVGTKPIAILTNRSSEVIDASSYGQLFLFNSSDCIVENGSFDNRSVGVSLAFCDDCVVRDLSASHNAVCLAELQCCFNTEVTRCNITEPHSAGFRFARTVGCALTDCKMYCEKEYHSVVWVPGVDLCGDENTTIARNILRTVGVIGVGSTNCLILDNDIEGDLDSEGDGILFGMSHNLIIEGNELHELENGISFAWGTVTNGTILNNCIHHNRGYGVVLDQTCESLRIYNNSFCYNYLGNALDNGALNRWDDGVSVGNQWDDYSGTGFYNVSGSAGSVDHFPRAYQTPTATTTTTTTATITTSTTTSLTDVAGDFLILSAILGVCALGVVVVVIVALLRRRS